MTPNVVSKVRAHFDCDTADGLEIEEIDGTHWEKRLLGNELMTATISERDFALSAMTLALLADSGW